MLIRRLGKWRVEIVIRAAGIGARGCRKGEDTGRDYTLIPTEITHPCGSYIAISGYICQVVIVDLALCICLNKIHVKPSPLNWPLPGTFW